MSKWFEKSEYRGVGTQNVLILGYCGVGTQKVLILGYRGVGTQKVLILGYCGVATGKVRTSFLYFHSILRVFSQ